MTRRALASFRARTAKMSSCTTLQSTRVVSRACKKVKPCSLTSSRAPRAGRLLTYSLSKPEAGFRQNLARNSKGLGALLSTIWSEPCPFAFFRPSWRTDQSASRAAATDLLSAARLALVQPPECRIEQGGKAHPGQVWRHQPSGVELNPPERQCGCANCRSQNCNLNQRHSDGMLAKKDPRPC
jgi:hypothetical protein